MQSINKYRTSLHRSRTNVATDKLLYCYQGDDVQTAPENMHDQESDRPVVPDNETDKQLAGVAVTAANFDCDASPRRPVSASGRNSQKTPPFIRDYGEQTSIASIPSRPGIATCKSQKEYRAGTRISRQWSARAGQIIQWGVPLHCL
ncbi:MAG: hypothetical protein U5K56_13805 [Halioglobus sp.]|nr:hypothetical protein [Halioglobus sp.]